jgi:hypothetical protein
MRVTLESQERALESTLYRLSTLQTLSFSQYAKIEDESKFGGALAVELLPIAGNPSDVIS